jgi:hypothetical protein
VRVPNGYAFAENPPDDRKHRDFQLEWELVQRVEPDEAASIAREAERVAARQR